MLMLKAENVATPAMAEAVTVPDNVPPDGFVPMDMVMELVAVVTVLPFASCTVTTTAGETEAPAAVFDGWVVNPSLLAGATELAAKFKWKFVVPPSPSTDETMK